MKRVIILIFISLLITSLYSQNIDTLNTLPDNYYQNSSGIGAKLSFLRNYAENITYPQSAKNELIVGTEIISIKLFPNKKPEVTIINSLSDDIDQEIFEAFDKISKNFKLNEIKDTSIFFLPITFRIHGINYSTIPPNIDIFFNELNITASSSNTKNFKADSELLEQYQTAYESNKYLEQIEILNELKRRNPLNLELIEEHLNVSNAIGLENEVLLDKILLTLIDK